MDECEELAGLIARSARVLCADDYTPRQIDAALEGVFGVDTELVRDGTYFVVEDEGRIVACGGWSRRGTLFGGDAHATRDSRLLDPESEPAKVRAFFVDPAHARGGLGRMLLAACERAAREHGFRSLELMATLTGQKLYAKCGFVPGEPTRYEMRPELSLEVVPMRKELGAA
jgi:GNAT superfamily N-acetyltransferase